MNNLTAVGAYMSSIQQSYAKIQTAIHELRIRIDTVERALQGAQPVPTSVVSPDVNVDELKTLIQAQSQRIDQLDAAIAARVEAYLKSSTDIDEKIKNAINTVLEGLAAATSVEAATPIDLVSTEPSVATEPVPVKKVTRKKAN